MQSSEDYTATFQSLSNCLHFSIWTSSQLNHQENTSSSPSQPGRLESTEALFFLFFCFVFFYIKFWTLYKGKCLRICDNFANPGWVEIYLKFLLFVQKHVQSIYMCVFFYCKFMYILILYLKSYICYTMQIELFLYRKNYMGIVAICYYSVVIGYMFYRYILYINIYICKCVLFYLCQTISMSFNKDFLHTKIQNSTASTYFITFSLSYANCWQCNK